MTKQRLNELFATVMGQAKALGIPISKNIYPFVRVNGRAQTRFGCCRREADRFVIEISAIMLDAPEAMICQTLAHELLHTCPGCSNHGVYWQSYAARMNARYGYNIQRTNSFENLGIEDNRNMKYVIICRRCGEKSYRMKRSAIVDHPERYRCVCGGPLKVETL